jgi:ribosomal protein S4
MFTPRSNAVVPMSAEYLAQFDGSELARGAGSGLAALELPSKDKQAEKEIQAASVPYMNMTFAPLERRLDTAVFRALFASSIRQARQFVIHGSVKVNGKTLRHPGYLLNPGDMFQVEMERVLFAVGAPKASSKPTEPTNEEESHSQLPDIFSSGAGSAATEGVAPEGEEPIEIPTDQDIAEATEGVVSPATKVLQEASSLLKTTDQSELSAKSKQSLRAISRAVKKLAPVRAKASEEDCIALQSAIDDFKKRISSKDTEETSESSSGVQPNKVGSSDGIDPTKPYATPWRPRDYLAPFMFVPRYLEINHKICSAVYLRHPVAKPDQAEVPTPFPEPQNQLAFNWYLKRG